MPEASAELRSQWPGGDAQAIQHLEATGFELLRDWTWRKPSPAYELTDRDRSAVIYLIDEWDFGGIAPQ